MSQSWPRGGDPQAAKVSGTPTDGQGLAYDAATGFWLPVDLASTATFATDAELAAGLATKQDAATAATDAELAAHEADTTSIHGIADTSALATDSEVAAVLAALVPAGSIIATGRSSAPTGWLLCDGSSLLRADYADLFSAIGTTYGSVDGTHFTVPDLRGRVMMGVDGAAARIAANDALGNSGGAETHTHAFDDGGHTHTIAHTHSFSDTANTGTATDTGGLRGAGSVATPIFGHTHSVTVSGTTGGSSAANSGSGTADGTTDPGSDLQPYQVVNHLIKT
jgi:microcystin-dependent protein